MSIQPISINSNENFPRITIIIPTLNESSFIEQTLTQLNSQTYPKHLMEVLVIDGGSIDNTCEVVHQWSEAYNFPVQVIYNPKKISSCARNIGINMAQGEYILFIDAHVFIPSHKLVENMARSAIQQKAMILGRAQPLSAPMLNDLQMTVAGVRKSKLGHSTKSFIYSDYEGWVSPISIGVMYHYSIFKEVGYFDENFDAAEDVEFNFRLEERGYAAYISPDFKILYYPRKNLSGLAKQMFRYGLGRARFTQKHIKGFQLELFVPVAILILFIIFSLLILNRDTAILSICVALTSYVIVFLTLFKSCPKAIHSLMAPVCLLVIHTGLAAGLIAGFIEKAYKRELNNDE